MTLPAPAPSSNKNKGFENRRINLTLLFGGVKMPENLDHHTGLPRARREVLPEEAGNLRYCL